MMARRCTAGSDISSVSLVVRRGTRRWDREVRYDAEVVARPHAVYRLVEDALAGGDIERGTMVAAADHCVVDPAAQLKRPVAAAGHQGVARRERVTGIDGVGALPGVPGADARVTQGLQPAPEAHASRVGGSVEVAGQDHVAYLPLAQQTLYEARGRHSLQLALVLEAQLPRGVMVGEQQRSERSRCQDLRNRYFARVDAGGDVQGLLPHLPYFPAARDRKSRALAICLVGDVVARAEQVGDLVVPVGHHRLLEGDDVRSELAQAVNEDRPTLVPRAMPPPQVERGDAHLARCCHSRHCKPPGSLSSARTRGLSIVARIEADSPQPGSPSRRACAGVSSSLSPPGSLTNKSSTKLIRMMPASNITAAVQSPVASRSVPLMAGERTAPISPIRFHRPKAAPRYAALGTRSAVRA